VNNFFYPSNIAIFGVSPTDENLARIIVENLDRFKFAGKVFPVGTKKGKLSKRKILTSVNEIKETPDLAVILVPGRFVPETLVACGKKGIRHVIIESGGFTEFDEGKKGLEDQIQAIAEQYGIQVIGPNCFGVINLENGVILPFFVLNPSYMKKGSVSLISQSGGIFYDTSMLASCEGVGLNKLISIGNKLLTNEITCLEYLAKDKKTTAIGLYLENFTNGGRLMKIAAQTAKPIVCLKANRSPAAEEVARFHTTALAGDDTVADAALEQAGIHRVQNFREMLDAFKVFSIPLIKGNRLALITRSGGHGVLAGDAAHRHGFETASLSDSFFDLVKSKKINVIRTTNPVDVGDVYSLNVYGEIIEKALQEENVDGVVFVATFSSETDGFAVEKVLRDAARLTPMYGKPIVFCMVTNKEQWFPLKEIVDFPVFTDVDDALKTLALSREHWNNLTKRSSGRKTMSFARHRKTLKVIDPSGAVDGASGFSLLREYGITVADYSLVTTHSEATKKAQEIGYPIAIKTASPLVLHKTEQGGVILNIKNDRELGNAINKMKSDAYLLQKMVPAGIEVIVGGKRDREFGPVILFGLGGIFVEVFKDTVIRSAPVDLTTAAEMIDAVKGSKLLKGFRGSISSDNEALAHVLVNVSRLLMNHPEITNLDINPLIVFEKGKGCVAVDVKMQVCELVEPE
jgi:acetate---CoA ligase (ADP-forming)